MSCALTPASHRYTAAGFEAYDKRRDTTTPSNSSNPKVHEIEYESIRFPVETQAAAKHRHYSSQRSQVLFRAWGRYGGGSERTCDGTGAYDRFVAHA